MRIIHLSRISAVWTVSYAPPYLERENFLTKNFRKILQQHVKYDILAIHC